jgi:hypothetical protein
VLESGSLVVQWCCTFVPSYHPNLRSLGGARWSWSTPRPSRDNFEGCSWSELRRCHQKPILISFSFIPTLFPPRYPIAMVRRLITFERLQFSTRSQVSSVVPSSSPSPQMSQGTRQLAARAPIPDPDPASPPTPRPTAVPAPAWPVSQEDKEARKPGTSKEHFPAPKLRLEIRDLRHPGAKAFLEALEVSDCFSDAVKNVQRLLYIKPSCPSTTLPTTRSVTLILRDMDGVAYTTGSDLDDDHKEIHLSLSYVAKQPADRCCNEITGVLTHELVHCYQYNGFHSCPGGLIEGIADWVRLRCHLCPPHWKPRIEGGWDGGYETTAYFLDYLERQNGNGMVSRMNERLRVEKYHEKRFWVQLFGQSVQDLWQDYCAEVKGGRLRQPEA